MATTHRVGLAFLVTLATLGLGSQAWAQTEKPGPRKSFGARLGYGTNPDQFVVGAQTVLGRTLGFMRFAPSVDAGFGDDMTTVLLNADVHALTVSPPGSPAGLYVGGGPALAYLDHKSAGSDTEIGVNLLAGLTFPMGRSNLYNLECRFGLADMPDLRILLGIYLGGNKTTEAPRTIEIRR